MRQITVSSVLLMNAIVSLAGAQDLALPSGSTTDTATTAPAATLGAGPIPAEYWFYLIAIVLGHAAITGFASRKDSFMWQLMHDTDLNKPSASRYIAILGSYTVTITFILALRFGFADLVKSNDGAFFNDAVRNVFIAGSTVFLPYIAGKVLQAATNVGSKAADKNVEAAEKNVEAANKNMQASYNVAAAARTPQSSEQ